MPTNANAYNSRITDEALEKKFRDAFRSQGGAELVDDLYASGVIVPVIDFTTAAEGSVLAENLQTAWDFSTGHDSVSNTSTTIISNSGFWKVSLNAVLGGNGGIGVMTITDGLSSKTIWRFSSSVTGTNLVDNATDDQIVFLRANDSLVLSSNTGDLDIDVWYRQIADVNGNLVNPTGFTSS